MPAQTLLKPVPDAPVARPFILRPFSTVAQAPAGASAEIAAWMRAYLMQPHPDLGRAGAVCPFTPTSAKSDLAYIGESFAATETDVYAVMRRAVAAFDSIECPPAQKPFRCVIVAFPACRGEEGRALLKRVQNRLRPESTRRAKMIGLFEPEAEDRGLLNPKFRPLRAPVPLLAIRALVEGDAPFVLRNPRLAPIYLWKFPRSGPWRLLKCLKR